MVDICSSLLSAKHQGRYATTLGHENSRLLCEGSSIIPKDQEITSLTFTGLPMSQAIVDPSEIRRFASSLKRFNADLQSALAGLHGQLVALGDTWRDQEHDRFRGEFEQTVHVVEHFLAVSTEHIPFLLRKAERIEEYLSQR